MLKDCKINKAIINEHKQLVVNMMVKPGDYDDIEAELLRIAKIEGNTIDFSLEGFTKQEEEIELKDKRQKLDHLMRSYCEKFGIKYEIAKDDLYKTKNIKSRTELSLTQLDELIDSYTTAIRTDTP